MNMRSTALAALLSLLPLGACASDSATHVASGTSTEDAAQARLPEVRYYVIADT